MPAATSASWSRASRTMSCADGGSGGRGGRRSTKRSAPRSSRKVKFEPPPSPIRARSDRPAAETVRVEERLEPVENQERRALQPFSLQCGRRDVHDPMLRRIQHRP